MTAFSTVMGAIPLILATGPGAVSRTNLGVVIFAGVTVATFFTLFIVPAFYDILARRTGSPLAISRRLKQMQAKPAG
jgi:multidrug efflux pump